jgi:hypothetical protein
MNSILATASSTKPTPFIAWHSLGEAVLASAVFGIGIILVISVAISLQSTAGEATGARKALRHVGTALGVAVAVAAVAFGIFIMVHKPS